MGEWTISGQENGKIKWTDKQMYGWTEERTDGISVLGITLGNLHCCTRDESAAGDKDLVGCKSEVVSLSSSNFFKALSLSSPFLPL